MSTRQRDALVDCRDTVCRRRADRAAFRRPSVRRSSPKGAAATVDLGGTLARALAYGTAIRAPLIRADVGDELGVTVANRVNHPTSVHWHGTHRTHESAKPYRWVQLSTLRDRWAG